MRLDRRTTIKWVLAAAATVPSLKSIAFAAEAPAREVALGQAGYGTDPDLQKEWKPGGPWPLTLTEASRQTAAALCDLIIPADDVSPAASAVGVVDFIDEWISAPYPQQREDRKLVLTCLVWFEKSAQVQFGKSFTALSDAQKSEIADLVCSPIKPEHGTNWEAAILFAKFRDLTAGGFYTTPVGMNDIGYRGNVQLERFDGPPPEALKKAGLG